LCFNRWILSLAKTKRPLDVIIENQQSEKQHIKKASFIRIKKNKYIELKNESQECTAHYNPRSCGCKELCSQNNT